MRPLRVNITAERRAAIGSGLVFGWHKVALSTQYNVLRTFYMSEMATTDTHERPKDF
jgi:hypothetical protein